KNDFTVETLNGDTCFLSSTRYDLSSEFDPTLPELPVIYVNLLLPSDSTYASFSYTQSSTSILPNILLTNCSEIVSTDDPYVPSGEWYPITTYQPGIEYVGATAVSGYQLVTFKVKPCKYNASLKRVYFYRFTLSVTLQPTAVVPRNGGKRGSHDRAEIAHWLWNTDNMETWYPWDESSVYPVPSEDGSILKDRYIIVTNNTLKPAFQPLIEWKRMKGLDAEIITRETINASATVSGDTGIHKIKHYLKNLYDNDPDRDNKDFFLLLGGDVNIVPTAYCKSDHSSDLPTNALLPCDMYYGCFEKNWMWDSQINGFRNNVLGEYDDSLSVNNNMYVTRASVRNTEQANVFVNKIIQYEANPPLNNNWGDSILFLGSIYNSPDEDNISNYNIQSLIHNNNYDLLFYEGDTSVVKEDSFRLAAYNALVANYSFISEFSHGEHDCWYLTKFIPNNNQYHSFVTTTEINNLNSDYQKIIISSSCLTNSFDIDEVAEGLSLSESFMRNNHSGVAAYIGYSRNGYHTIKQNNYLDYYSPLFSKRFTLCLFSNNYPLLEGVDSIKTKHLGKVVDYAKWAWQWATPVIINRWNPTNKKLYFSGNTLGDPEMPIYTQHPMLFDSVSCQIDTVNNKIIISTGVADTRLHIISNGKLYETTETTYELPMMSKDSIEFVLTKQNYIPTLFTPFKTTKYIQNETISENTSHTGYDYIKVGRNVDITKPFGNVVVSSGKSLNLKANKEIEIRNNIEVQSGAELIIDVEP
ncbi:MAG: hypothetical protein J6H19_01110, partial [Bacteroidaceae bacterium]|nr:hypothetical protein [Bacteroidaceae bacterium]